MYSHIAAGPPSLQVPSQIQHRLDLPQTLLQIWFSFPKIAVRHSDVSERHWLLISMIASATSMGQTAEFTARHVHAGRRAHLLLAVSPGCKCFSLLRSDLHEKPRVPITALHELMETKHQGPAKSKLCRKPSLPAPLPLATMSLLYAIEEVSFKVFQLTIFPGSPIH